MKSHFFYYSQVGEENHRPESKWTTTAKEEVDKQAGSKVQVEAKQKDRWAGKVRIIFLEHNSNRRQR